MTEEAKPRVGILAPRDEADRHLGALEAAGAEAIRLEDADGIDGLDGIVVCGSDPFSIGEAMVESGMMDAVRSFFYTGGAVWGVQAGMVLAASTTTGERQPLLGLMNAMVERDGFGESSGEIELDVKEFDFPVSAVFDRSPYFEMIGPGVEAIAEYEGKVVAAKGEGILVTAFNPVSRDDVRFHKYFIEEVCTR